MKNYIQKRLALQAVVNGNCSIIIIIIIIIIITAIRKVTGGPETLIGYCVTKNNCNIC